MTSGTPYYCHFQISYNCLFTLDNIGFWCTNELSPRFSIPKVVKSPSWNWNTSTNTVQNSSISLYHYEENGKTCDVTCEDCFLINTVKIGNCSLSIRYISFPLPPCILVTPLLSISHILHSFPFLRLFFLICNI